MTNEQRDHAESIADEFVDLMLDKYEKGAREHGGNLWQVSTSQLLDFAIEEAIDQVVYLFTLKEQLAKQTPTAEADNQ